MFFHSPSNKPGDKPIQQDSPLSIWSTGPFRVNDGFFGHYVFLPKTLRQLEPSQRVQEQDVERALSADNSPQLFSPPIGRNTTKASVETADVAGQALEQHRNFITATLSRLGAGLNWEVKTGFVRKMEGGKRKQTGCIAITCITQKSAEVGSKLSDEPFADNLFRKCEKFAILTKCIVVLEKEKKFPTPKQPLASIGLSSSQDSTEIIKQIPRPADAGHHVIYSTGFPSASELNNDHMPQYHFDTHCTLTPLKDGTANTKPNDSANSSQKFSAALAIRLQHTENVVLMDSLVTVTLKAPKEHRMRMEAKLVSETPVPAIKIIRYGHQASGPVGKLSGAKEKKKTQLIEVAWEKCPNTLVVPKGFRGNVEASFSIKPFPEAKYPSPEHEADISLAFSSVASKAQFSEGVTGVVVVIESQWRLASVEGNSGRLVMTTSEHHIPEVMSETESGFDIPFDLPHPFPESPSVDRSTTQAFSSKSVASMIGEVRDSIFKRPSKMSF